MKKTIIITMIVLMAIIGIASAYGENCTIDDDCSTCEYCNATSYCDYQASGTDPNVDCGFCQACDGAGSCSSAVQLGTDIKDECGTDSVCSGAYAYWVPNGNCDGGGSCDLGYAPYAVVDGHVCINSTSNDVAPTADVNAGIWSDCVQYETSADEYYVGYCNPDYPFSYGNQYSCDNGWVITGTTWSVSTPGYFIEFTEQTDECSEVECLDDYDCGACYVCNSGTCEPAPYDTDPKDDCSLTWDCGGIDINSIYRTQPGNCISGYCRGSSWYPGPETYVGDGNICKATVGQDVDPTTDYNAGIWSDCMEGNITAPEYYIGYCSGTPCDTDWITAGTIWNATSGYEINQTEQVDTCSEALASRVGGGGTWPTEEPPVTTQTSTGPTTFSLASFLEGRINILDYLWDWIKNILGIR